MDAVLLIPILLGWISGLFINYLADVLPHPRRLSQPACPHCRTPFAWTDYLALRPCRSCGRRRSLRTWLVQIFSVASFVYFWLFPSRVLGIPLGLIVLIYFAVITVIDLEHRLILHPTSIAGALLGLIVGTYIHSKQNSLLVGMRTSLLGGLFGFAVMFVVYQLGTIVARYRAGKMRAAGEADDEEEAFGGGDVFLAGVLGLMIGWPLIWEALVRGVLLGALVSLVLILGLVVQRRYSSRALMTFIPYGPYFIISAFYVLFIL